MTDQTLQADYALLSERTHEKAGELTQAQQMLSDLILDLVDSSAKARPAILARRAELTNNRDALAEELQVLTTRRDAANVAICTFEFAKAEAVVLDLSARSTTARLALTKLLEEQRIFLSKGSAGMPEAEADKKRIELATKSAQLQGENQVLERDTHRAATARDRAKAALDELRKALGIQVQS